MCTFRATQIQFSGPKVLAPLLLQPPPAKGLGFLSPSQTSWLREPQWTHTLAVGADWGKLLVVALQNTMLLTSFKTNIWLAPVPSSEALQAFFSESDCRELQFEIVRGAGAYPTAAVLLLVSSFLLPCCFGFFYFCACFHLWSTGIPWA